MTKVERQKEWENRITAYTASGWSTKEWCAAHDLKPHQLWLTNCVFISLIHEITPLDFLVINGQCRPIALKALQNFNLH